MWIKCTPDEIAKVRIQQKRRRRQWAFTAGAFLLLLLTFTPGRHVPQGQSWLVSRDEVPGRLLLAVPQGIAFGVFTYWLNLGRYRRMMVCPKCEATKYAGSVSACACGGTFEDADTMKWE
jgi:hypothetical protein